MSKIKIDMSTQRSRRGLPPLAGFRNGTIVSAESVRSLGALGNYLNGARLQVLHAMAWNPRSELTPSATTAEATTFACMTSRNCRALFWLFVVHPPTNAGTTADAKISAKYQAGWDGSDSLSGSVGFSTLADDESATGFSLYSGGRGITSGTGRVQLDNLCLVSGTSYAYLTEFHATPGATAGQAFRFRVEVTNGPCMVSALLFEVQFSELETGGSYRSPAVVDTTKVSGHGPILAQTFEELIRGAHDVWSQPQQLLAWGDCGGDPTGSNRPISTINETASTFRNIQLASVTAGSATSPGQPIDVSYCGSQDSSKVGCAFWHLGKVATGSGTYHAALRDQADRTICTIEDSSTDYNWRWATGYLTDDSGATPTTKLDVLIKHISGGSSTAETVAVGAIRLNPIDPRLYFGSRLAAWYEAESLTRTLTDGARVTSWEDLSQYGNTLTATGAGGSEPILRTNVVNGLSAVEFSPADASYFTNADSGTDSYHSGTPHIFAVAKSDVTGALRLITGYAHSASADGARWQYGMDSTNAPEVGVNNSAFVFGSTATRKWTEWCCHRLSAGFNPYVNGVGFGSGPGGPVSYPANTGLYVGGRTGFVTTNMWDGHIAELLIVTGEMGEGEKVRVEQYLCLKYGISTAFDP